MEGYFKSYLLFDEYFDIYMIECIMLWWFLVYSRRSMRGVWCHVRIRLVSKCPTLPRWGRLYTSRATHTAHRSRVAPCLEVSENIFDEKVREKSRKFLKNCQSQGKIIEKLNCFSKYLAKYWHRIFYFYILPEDKCYHCYFLLYC